MTVSRKMSCRYWGRNKLDKFQVIRQNKQSVGDPIEIKILAKIYWRKIQIVKKFVVSLSKVLSFRIFTFFWKVFNN